MEAASKHKSAMQARTLALLAKLVIAIACVIPGPGVFADDSIARIGAGGIGFLKSDDIRMVEEVLWISTDAIRVKFRFLNESERDISATVAFPIPPFNWNTFHHVDTKGRRKESYKSNFVVRVNGHPVSATTVRHAVVEDSRLEALQHEFGLSDKQMAEITYWRQVFPAGKEVVVEHAYTPFVGGSYLTPYRTEDGNISGILIPPMETGVCLDDRTKQAITKRVKAHLTKGAKYVQVFADDVEYILWTGRNWKGPIGKFTLRIEKERPDQYISLCFPGEPIKVSPTVYEFHHRDFVPPDRVVVNFYTVR